MSNSQDQSAKPPYDKGESAGDNPVGFVIKSGLKRVPTTLIKKRNDFTPVKLETGQDQEEGLKYFHPDLNQWMPFPTHLEEEVETPTKDGKNGKAKQLWKKITGSAEKEEEAKPEISWPIKSSLKRT